MMAFGAVIYFNLPFEPNIIFPFLIAALFGLISFFYWNKSAAFSFICLICFGFFYSAGFTHYLDTPRIKYTLRNTEISGTVSNIDHTDGKPRIFIETMRGTVRVSSDIGVPNIGDTVTAIATLYPPNLPSAPETFDYSRWAYFNGLSATGYITEFEITKKSEIQNLDVLRNNLHNRADSFLADTLVLGYKNAVPKSDASIWTATGINHVWSISGFHMTLVGGWLFAMFYFLFRGIAPLTRNIPARFPALICAGAGLLFYLFLSGNDIATIRAFSMTILLFAGFILGRYVSPMRSVSFAFIFLFLLNPHYITQAGFQLSFAAIYGLVWWFGRPTEFKKRGPVARLGNIIKIAAETSIIATIFTAPFVTYHFYSLPIYGLIGNMILLPIFSFIIMPLVLLGTIFPALLPYAHDVYNWSLGIAQHIAALPHSVVQMPHVSGAALLMIIFGFLCLILVRARRAHIILFFVFVAAGITTIILEPRPIFYSTHDSELVGFVGDDNKLVFNKARASNHYFAFETWRQLNFEVPTDTNTRFKCVDGVCDFGKIVYIQKYVPLAKNIVRLCADKNVEFIVSYFDVTAPNCHARVLNGGFVIYENGDVRHTIINRKWH